MLKYTLQRIILIIPVIIGVIILIFTINYLSGDSPAEALFGVSATPEFIDEWNEAHGLNRPYLIQLGEYIWNVFTKFDFGTSYIYNIPVTQLIGQRFGVTCKIGILGILLAVVVGIPLGIVAAVKQYSAFDYASTVTAVLCSSLPNFWVALMLMLLFAVHLGWVPVSGVTTWKGYILPVVSVAVSQVALLCRMTRSSMLEVIRQDYVRTARAKGLSEWNVITKHVLKNGLIPVVTVIGMLFGMSMVGTVLIETIFNISGMGLLIYNSILTNDFLTVQGCVIICAIVVTVCNLLTDIAYAFIDPRIKARYASDKKKKKTVRKTLTADSMGGAA